MSCKPVFNPSLSVGSIVTAKRLKLAVPTNLSVQAVADIVNAVEKDYRLGLKQGCKLTYSDWEKITAQVKDELVGV